MTEVGRAHEYCCTRAKTCTESSTDAESEVVLWFHNVHFRLVLMPQGAYVAKRAWHRTRLTDQLNG